MVDERYGDLYVFGYIIAVSFVMGGRRRAGGSWSAIGVKPVSALADDLTRVWGLALVVVVLFQLLSPSMLVARLGGYYPELVQFVDARVSQVPVLVGLALILTLLETLVYQVCVQENLARVVGTPVAVLVAATLAGLAHAASAGPGSLGLSVADAAGVAVDFVVFGMIWARSHNLVLTWAVHYAADLVGILALAMIFT